MDHNIRTLNYGIPCAWVSRSEAMGAPSISAVGATSIFATGAALADAAIVIGAVNEAELEDIEIAES